MKQVKKFKLVPVEMEPKQVKESENNPPQPELQPTSPIQTQPQNLNQIKLSDDKILMAIPKSLPNKAKALLGCLHEIPNIDWDEKGQVSIDKDLLTHSHISDLIKRSIFHYKRFNPVGMGSFHSVLVKNNIPCSILQQGLGDYQFPPPGLPMKRVKQSKSKKLSINHSKDTKQTIS